MALVPSPQWLDTGDNAWQLAAATFVGLQSIPGLVVLYGGVVKKKWAINSAFMAIYAFASVLIVWVLFAYNMAFGQQWFPFVGVPQPALSAGFITAQATIPAAATGMPALAFPMATLIFFQFVFAAITVIILAGSVLARMSFAAWVIFCPLWTTLVYTVGAFSLWGGGWLASAGVADFSGGYVIHLAAGTSGFVAAWVIGPRLREDRDHFPPNSLLLTLVGAGILWLGWNGLNGGDPYFANADASAAVLNTNIATAVALLVWTLMDVLAYGRPSALGAVNGMIAGLVAITPGAGYVDGFGAIIIGVCAGVIPWLSMNKLQKSSFMMSIDDTLSVFSTHGVAGLMGGLLVGVLANPDMLQYLGTDRDAPGVNVAGLLYGNASQLMLQAEGAAFIIAYNAIATFVILKVIGFIVPLRMDDAILEVADDAIHGELAYAMEEGYASATSCPSVVDRFEVNRVEDASSILRSVVGRVVAFTVRAPKEISVAAELGETSEARRVELKRPPPPGPGTPEKPRTPTPAPPEPPARYLRGRMPEQVKLGADISLQVCIALQTGTEPSAKLRPFTVPPQGMQVKLVLYCPGFAATDGNVRSLKVPAAADSDWTYFELRALREGTTDVEVTAYDGAAYLGSLRIPTQIHAELTTGVPVECSDSVAERSPESGEATLTVYYQPNEKLYRFTLRSEFFETGEIPLPAPDPSGQFEKLIKLMNAQAQNKTGLSDTEARRRLRSLGENIWKEMIPAELKTSFWELDGKISRLNILSAGDQVPWEMMYPYRTDGGSAAANRGFLSEQLVVTRWLFGPSPRNLVRLFEPYFVVPGDAPPRANTELEALRSKLGRGERIADLTPLFNLIDKGEFGLLHFAAHNVQADYLTASFVKFGDKHFEVTDLPPSLQNRYREKAPLIFMNTCRSGGLALNYTQLTGWATAFVTAGAGAFVGSLWEVRDTSAKEFAESFYGSLLVGKSLGEAMKEGRQAVAKQGDGDPTWLAYTLYGDPNAVAKLA